MSRFPSIHVAAAALAGAALLAAASMAAAQPAVLRSPDGGEVRALVVGVDAYQNVRPLKGAVADANDIADTLKKMGVRDLTELTDAQVERRAVLGNIDALMRRSNRGDVIVLSIAGHGMQEPERVKGSQPDGMDNVFLLAGFDPKTPEGSEQRIIGTEFNHLIREFESHGVRVIFIADACYGGGLAREIDPRGEEMSYRQAPRYTILTDALKPISTTQDAFLTDFDFQNTAFLAAVDRNTKAPEVRIPGIPGYRGALSYAMARAFEGSADGNADGKVTMKELFGYVRQIAYQLSDQRQNVVTSGPSTRDVDSDVAYALTRSVVLLDSGDAKKLSAPPPTATASAVPAAPAAAPSASPAPPAVRIAVLDGQRDRLADLRQREVPFQVVGPKENPDIVWDPNSRDVLVGADVIARRVEAQNLSGVIDRMASIRGFNQLSAKGAQTVRVLPNDALHRNDSRVEIQVSGVANRALILFNIAGDGTVQALYPIGSDPAIVQTADYSFPVQVREPFGADQLIAITSSQRMTDLEQIIKRMNQRQTAYQVYKLVERYLPADARIGTAGLFTAP